MLSFEEQRRSRPTFISMKNAINIGQKQQKLQKLGGAIKASIQKLKKLNTDIIAQTDVKKLSILFVQYQKQNDNYIDLQKSLVQIDEKSDTLDKILMMNKLFLDNHNPQQLQKKINFMKSQRVDKTQSQAIQMERITPQYQGGQLIQISSRDETRRKMMQEQLKQVKQLQRIAVKINEITKQTTSMILEQGMKLKIAAATMSRVRDNYKDARGQLTQANQYQQDTNKKLVSFCLLIVLVVCIVIMIMYSSKKQT